MASNDPNIDRLISLYLSRRASESERQELEAWLQASLANRKVFEHLEKLWCSDTRSSSFHHEYDADRKQVRDEIWRAGTKGQQPMKTPVRRTLDIFFWGRVAAAVLLLLLGAWLFAYLTQENTVATPEAIALVEKVNPAGQKSVHKLPDGTQVSLNAASRLVYPEQFADTLRRVYLSGEAFFEVVKDVQRPFVVEAAGTRTQALGTAFNIHAYVEDDTIKIALLEGKVRVEGVDQLQAAILSPGEELLVSKGQSTFSQQSFSYENAIGWKEGRLIFDGTDFAGFCRAIERWYGVTVEVKGTPPSNWHLRAQYQQEDLRHVLRDVCFNKNINFELEDKNVLLTF